jgi:PAS domain S-box-containing protein
MRDVTIGERLPDAAALLDVIFGQSPVGVAVFDTSRRYVRVNPALQRLVGLPEGEMLGRTVREVVPGPVGAFADARLGEVLRTGEPLIGADLEGRLPSAPGDRSLIVSYFRLEGPAGAVLGAASVVSDVSDRHGTRRALERANARLELLSRATAALGASLELPEILTGLADVVVPAVADHCAVDLVPEDAAAEEGVVRLLRSISRHEAGAEPPEPDAGTTEGTGPWAPVGALVPYRPGHPVAEAFRTGRVEVRSIDPAVFDYDAVAPSAESARFARAMGIRSALTVPLRAHGRTIGVLSLAYSVSGRSHGDDDVLVATQVADRAAVAIENARLHRRERQRGLALQRSLLPETLPSVPGLRMAARYLPAGGRGEVGGDWYDVIRLAAGRVAIVVGDVMGRGVGAAALMGQLRAGLRAYAVQDQPPSLVLTSADQLVRGLGDDVIVTCVYAVLDPRDGTLVVANAGHVPPLIVDADGPQSVDEGSALAATGPPLGAGGARPYRQVTVHLTEGQLLALYTDGLVERRDADLGTGIGRFARQLDPAAADLDALCELVIGRAEPDDDAALLLVVRDDADRPRSRTVPLTSDRRTAQVARTVVRQALGEWAEAQDLVDTAELAVSELVTNALRYGRPPIVLEVSRHVDGVVLEVTDAAPGSPRVHVAAPSDEGGRGLFLVHAVSQAWGVRPLEDGKVVWCHLARTR